MILYFSGTPGIEGGLPEELLRKRLVSIMASFAESRKMVVKRLRRIRKARRVRK